MMNRTFPQLVAGGLLLVSLTAELNAQSLVAPFNARYNIRYIGAPENLDEGMGGFAFRPGQSNVLVFTEHVINPPGHLVQATLTRDASGHITGFAGNSTKLADVISNPDGGLTFAPNGIIFVTANNSTILQQFAPGATSATKISDLEDLGISVGGTHQFVPAGMPGAGSLKVLASDRWFSVPYSPDAMGTYNFAAPVATIELTNATLSGAAFVRAGAPLFTNHSVLVSDVNASTIAAFQLDANGDPIPSTRREFISNLINAGGGATDPVTGDFLFTTGGGIYVVGGFTPVAPSVSIVAPENNASFGAPAALNIFANATQSNGNVGRVEFFINGGFAGASLGEPFMISTNLGAGSYTLRAVAVDGAGQRGTSAPVNITVTNVPNQIPGVTLVAPTSNAVFNVCGDVLLHAQAADMDGTVVKVEFYHGGTKLGEDTTPPFQWQIAYALPGNYTLSARAIDNLGGVGTSAPVNITVYGPAPGRLVIAAGSNSTMRLCFNGTPGSNYVFEATTNLNAPIHWTPLRTNTVVAGSLLQHIDTNTSVRPMRFYRTRRQP